MSRSVTISLYCMYEWWQAFFYDHYPRPAVPSDSALEQIYLARQKFLHEHFGEFGIGDPDPRVTGAYVNMIARYSLDFVPSLFGVELKAYEGGGYTPTPLSEEAVRELKPIRFADTPMADWVLRRAAQLKARYGSAVSNIALESPLNLAYRIRGEEFFVDMYDDPELAHHLLDVITETILDIYRFQRDVFGLEEYTIANCLASSMLSPTTYAEFGLPYDLRLAEACPELTGGPNRVRMHHCDALIDSFAPYYAKLPHLKEVEARTTSDYGIIRQYFPGATMSAMVNCRSVATKSIPDLLREDIEPALREDITSAIDLWTFSTETPPQRLKELMAAIRELCGKYEVEPVWSMHPFYWEELEWAYPWWEPYLDRWAQTLGA